MTGFFARPDLPRAVRRKEAAVWYSTLLWAAWELYNVGQLSEAEEYLRRSLGYARGGRELAALDWAGAFARFSRRDGQQSATLKAAAPIIHRAAGANGGLAPIMETAIRFRLEVLEGFFSTGALPDTPGLTEFRNLTPRQLLKTAQSALVSFPTSVGTARVARFWEAMLRAGVVTYAARHDIAALFMALFAVALARQQWRTALESGLRALQAAAHPRALRALVDFFRSAVIFLLHRWAGEQSSVALWGGSLTGARGNDRVAGWVR